MNRQHPRQFGYFTPPPLPMSIMGELLAQVDQPGRRRLARRAGRAPSSRRRSSAGCATSSATATDAFGLLTRGGVMANFMAMALARDLHLGRLRGLGRPPRGRTSRAPASTPATRPTSRSRGRSTSSGSRPTRWSSCRPTTRSGCAARPVADGDRPRPGRRPDPVRDRGGRRLDEHGLGRCHRRARGRRRRARTCGSTSMRRMAAAVRLSERDRGPGPGPRSRRLGDRRPAQVVLPGLRHRRAAGPRRRDLAAVFGGRAPEYYRGGEGPGTARRRPRDGERRRRHDDHGDQLNFYKLGVRGHAALARAQAVDVVEAPRDERLRPAHRGQRRPRRATSRAAAPKPTTSRRCRRSRSCPSCASATCPAAAALALAPASSMPTRIGCSARSRPRATAGSRRRGCAGATWLRAGIVNYLATEDDIDRLLETLRTLAADDVTAGRRAGPGRSTVDCDRVCGPPRRRAASSIASSTSRTWNASSAARAMRALRPIASIMSARPMPRPTRPANCSGTSSQVSSPIAPEADLPVEPVRVAEAERSRRPVDLDDAARAAGRRRRTHAGSPMTPDANASVPITVGRHLGDERSSPASGPVAIEPLGAASAPDGRDAWTGPSRLTSAVT